MIKISPLAIDQGSRFNSDLKGEGLHSWLQRMVSEAVQLHGCISPLYHKTLKMQVIPLVTPRGNGYLLLSIERAAR